MNKILQARLKQLDSLLENAVVEPISTEDGVYRVFVPGAIREDNRVKASDEREAVEKVKSVLTAKIEERSKKSPGDQSDGTLQVQNVKQGAKAQEVDNG